MNVESPSTPLHDSVGLRGPVVFSVAGLLVFGLLYSLAGAGLGRAVFPVQATGSTIERDGRIVGSKWLAQPFDDARYFQPRPSAASYDPMSAAGSNLARSNPDLLRRIAEARAAVAAREGIAPEAVPIELVTQSGGGLDPDVTPEGARVQVARVAKARALDAAAVQALVDEYTQTPTLGVLGQARVNVLQLNLALDTMAPIATR